MTERHKENKFAAVFGVDVLEVYEEKWGSVIETNRINAL